MTEKIRKAIEELTKDCTQEDKAIILQIVTPGEPGAKKEPLKMDYTSAQFKRIAPILDDILAAIREDKKNVLKTGSWKPSAQKTEAEEEKHKIWAEKFQKQLEKARNFRRNHYKNGLELNKCCYLYELERAEEWRGIENAFNYGYMMGYRKAQEEARKEKKAAAANEI
jgi:hypothetical protein